MSGSSFKHHRLHALGVQNRRLLLRMQSANIQNQDSALELRVLMWEPGFSRFFILWWFSWTLPVAVAHSPNRLSSWLQLSPPSLLSQSQLLCYLLPSPCPSIILTVLKILPWVTFWYFPVLSQAYSPEVWVPEFLDLSDSWRSHLFLDVSFWDLGIGTLSSSVFSIIPLPFAVLGKTRNPWVLLAF